MCSGSEAGSYLRLIDSCLTQLKAQGPSRTCNESKEEEATWTALSIGGLEAKSAAAGGLSSESTCSACTRKIDVRLPGKGYSNLRGRST